MATFDWLAIIIGPQQWPLLSLILSCYTVIVTFIQPLFFLLVKFCQKEQFKKLKKKKIDIEVVF